MDRFLRCLNLALTVFFAAVIVAAAFVIVSARMAGDQIPTVAGYKVLTVLSGSMEPAIPTGGLVVVKSLAPGEQVRVGDVITFTTRHDKGIPTTHRVIDMTYLNGSKAYITKGDANNATDPVPVMGDQVISRMLIAIPYGGYIAHFAKERLGFTLAVVLPLAGVGVFELLRHFVANGRDKRARDVFPMAGKFERGSETP